MIGQLIRRREGTVINGEDVIRQKKKKQVKVVHLELLGMNLRQFRCPVSMITSVDVKEGVGRVQDGFNVLNLGCRELLNEVGRGKRIF